MPRWRYVNRSRQHGLDPDGLEVNVAADLSVSPVAGLGADRRGNRLGGVAAKAKLRAELNLV